MEAFAGRLELWISASLDGKEFSLELEYRSVADVAIDFGFYGNRSGRLERTLLNIFEKESRERVRRSRYRHYSFRSAPKNDPNMIPPGGVFRYVLKGEYDGECLNFRAASYPLRPGEAYIMQVHSHGLLSNEIEVVMPFSNLG